MAGFDDDMAILNQCLRDMHDQQRYTVRMDAVRAPVTWWDVWSVMYQHQSSFGDDNVACLLEAQGCNVSRPTVYRRRKRALRAVREVEAAVAARLGAQRAADVIRTAVRMLDRSVHSGRPAAIAPPDDDAKAGDAA